MNYAPVRRAILDPYEQKYGKEMYVSDISDSDSETDLYLLAKVGRADEADGLSSTISLKNIVIDRLSTFPSRKHMILLGVFSVRILPHMTNSFLFVCEIDIFLKHVLIQARYLR